MTPNAPPTVLTAQEAVARLAALEAQIADYRAAVMWMGSLLRQIRPYLAHHPDCAGLAPPAACTCGAAHYQEQVRRTLRDYAPETFPALLLERNAGA